MADELKGLLGLLGERLDQHDNNRREVQSQLQETCAKMVKDADSLEEKISEKISKDFGLKEERILGFIAKLNEGEGDMSILLKQAKEELSREWKYEIQHSDQVRTFADSYELKVSSVEVERGVNTDNAESIVSRLQGHLNKLHDSVTAARDNLAKVCNERRTEVEELGKRINEELEEHFNVEDARIQGVVKIVREKVNSEDPDEVKWAVSKAKSAAFVRKEYSLGKGDLPDKYNLVVKSDVSLESIDFKERAPKVLTAELIGNGEVALSFAFFNEDEAELLRPLHLQFRVIISLSEKGEDELIGMTYTKEYDIDEAKHIFCDVRIAPGTTYCVKARIAHQGQSTRWSKETAEFTTPGFTECVWKKCPDNIEEKRKYSVDEKNPRVASRLGGYLESCTIVGSMPLPPGKVTTWGVKIVIPEPTSRDEIYIGVAPFGIDQGHSPNYEHGWYFECLSSTLTSGPPHGYRKKKYVFMKLFKKRIHTGDTVEVETDTSRGALSFIVKGKNYGVAYEGIPLDKPLVPCVILFFKGVSVELSLSEGRESDDINNSIPAPSNITAKSGIAWDSIALTWDAAEGASFYQVEVDGSKFWEASTTNSFTKRGLLPDTEHTFRVRAVRGNSVSEWSEVMKGRTEKESFEYSWWKECPDNVRKHMKYSVDEKNPRIATKTFYGYSIIIGNTPIPLNKVFSWSVKIFKSKDNDGRGILIGVAPSDINQNVDNVSEKCGWHFVCYSSTLRSGPPHNYKWKEYGPRKGNGQYVHTGDNVGVVMDTTKGELSFVVNGVNLGVAFEGIPLDKPLVPCAILVCNDESVELVI